MKIKYYVYLHLIGYIEQTLNIKSHGKRYQTYIAGINNNKI